MSDLHKSILVMELVGALGELKGCGEKEETDQRKAVFSPICWHHLTLLMHVSESLGSVVTHFEQNVLFPFLIFILRVLLPSTLPWGLPSLTPSLLYCDGLYLQLNGRWQGWIDLGVCSWGNIFSVLPASKKLLPRQSFQPCISLISQNERKNILALPERLFGKNQVCATEWSKVISIKNKSWSAAGILLTLSPIVLSLDTAPPPPLLCYTNGLCLSFPKESNLKEDVPGCIGLCRAWHGKAVSEVSGFVLFFVCCF